MAYQMVRILVILSELESHFCCYDETKTSRGPSASAELLVHFQSGKHLLNLAIFKYLQNYPATATVSGVCEPILSLR